jgi:hypothetical protein
MITAIKLEEPEMEIPKPVAIVIIIVAVVLAVGIGWYYLSGTEGSGHGNVPTHAYPQPQQNQPGVEAYGAQPPSNQPAPSVSICARYKAITRRGSFVVNNPTPLSKGVGLI